MKFNIDAKRSDLKNRNQDLGTMLSDLDAIRADVWARAKAFPFLKIPKSEPYTLKRFQDYLCFDLPKVVVEFGAHVRTDVIPLRVSSDERSAGMLEMVPRFFDISSPKHERIRLCGVEFERALVLLGGPIPSAVVSRSFLESLPTVVPGGICSTHGNILYSPLAVQETYSTFLDDLRQMLSLKGRPLADIVRELEAIDNSEQREVRALQLAYGLALISSYRTLDTVDTFLQYAVHAHEDYHLVSVYSGRSIQMIVKPVNNTFAAFEKAEYETSYASERSVYLKESTHFGSLGFGLAVMLRFCALHKMKPADPQGEYMAAAGSVIEALVSLVEKEPQKFGIAVNLSPKLTRRQQVLLQLTKIHDSQANLEDLRRKME